MVKKKAEIQKGDKGFSWRERKPVLQFAALFLISCLIFYTISGTEWFESVRRPLLQFFAWISAVILGVFQSDIRAVNETLLSPRFAVEIREGCDAIAPTVLYCLSVLFYPVSWDKRWRGILIGVVLLMLLNILRIVSLYLVGVYAPSWFEFMHVDFWQIGFILFTVVLWIYWMKWATQIKVT